MSERIINVLSNTNFESRKTTKRLIQKLIEHNLTPVTKVHPDAELTITVGGDGAFIKAVNRTHFSETPIVGINTGHLGFFQEIDPDYLDAFIQAYLKGDYKIETLHLVGAEIFTKTRSYFLHAINEIVLKAQNSKVIHMNVFIDRNHLERFSGDGMLVSSPSGTTGYNLSLGGSLIYPTLKAVALTPIAPISNQSYRSVTQTIVIPGDQVISLVPEKRYSNSNLLLVDGQEYNYNQLRKVNLRIADKHIRRLVITEQNYWDVIKSKFL